MLASRVAGEARVGEGSGRQRSGLSQATDTNRSANLLTSLRANLAVIPSTQWTVAETDFSGRKAQSLMSREVDAIQAMTAPRNSAAEGQSSQGNHDNAGEGAKQMAGLAAKSTRKRLWGKFRSRTDEDDNDGGGSTTPWYVV